jgi:hypothetical protein
MRHPVFNPLRPAPPGATGATAGLSVDDPRLNAGVIAFTCD